MTAEYRFTPPEALPEPLPSETTAKDERMGEALKRLEEGIEGLLDDPESYFRVMARFHEYSLANQIMIYVQDHQATHVAGYKQWKEKFERQVQKGAKAIKIFYPRFHKEINPETGVEEKVLSGFGLGNVFDVRHTEGKPLPELPSITEDVSTNDVATAVNLKLSRYLIDQGLLMESRQIFGHAQGYYAPANNQIVVDVPHGLHPLNAQKTKVLVHEAAHWMADHKDGIDRHDAETVAEASAFVVMNHFGLDTANYSFPYIAGWAKDRERLHTNLEEIRRVSRRLIGAIEGVGDPYADDFGRIEHIRWGDEEDNDPEEQG